ncbi:MAG: gamma carbonic anhydrase family protein [Chloroflexi bacterium]|nr:gamma carbonic anhydrase family protein [Chloroflexota bacterium]
MIESFDGKMPRVSELAHVHPLACVRGDVEIGDHCMVWPGAVITADAGTIRIGKCTIIEDNSSLHVGTYEDWLKTERGVLEIGDYVTIGHGAVVHGRKIGNHALIGMNAVVLQHVEIGESCIIAAGAVVPVGMKIPARSFVAGVPAKVKSELKKEQAYWVGDGFEERNTYYIDYIRKLKDSQTGGGDAAEG